MARVFLTGSSDGLGLLAGRLLVEWDHAVTLHARNAARAEEVRRALPEAEAVVIGDVSSITQTRGVAEQVNALGRFDAVIHNVGVGSRGSRVETEDGLSQTFAVNVLAPYLLTALISRPGRLIYLSSGMHRGADARLDDAQWAGRPWNGWQAYSESKLFDVMLAFAVARLWSKVMSNAIEPGWVATKMGGAGAPDDLRLGAVTQVWLAVSDDVEATVSGQYFYHQKHRQVHPAAREVALQEQLIDYCTRLTGLGLPST
jgi:NAD(P)-dependent dehydrogenase (short-subunit alcohol dehydrogenase family)